MLRTRQLIPPLSLHAADGGTIRAWDYKQKKNLVIAFLDADCGLCEDFLRGLAARAADLREKRAVALIAFLAPPPRAVTDSLPKEIIAGCDMPGSGARGFLGDDAFAARGLVRGGVFTADRYGELFARWSLAGHKFPAMEEIFGALEQIEMRCEGCEVPAAPADA
jgi:AhpC/TSA family